MIRSFKFKNYQFYLALSALVFWAIFIFAMSSFPAPASSSQSDFFVRPLQTLAPNTSPHTLTTIVRKIAHFTEYAILGFLAIITFYAYVNREKPLSSFIFRLRPTLIISLICLIYSITDEFHQAFIPGRSPQPIDVVIDTLGVIMGIIMFLVFTKYYKSCYNKKHGRN